MSSEDELITLIIIIAILVDIFIALLLIYAHRKESYAKLAHRIGQYGILLDYLRDVQLVNNLSRHHTVKMVTQNQFINHYALPYFANLLSLASGDIHFRHVNKFEHEVIQNVQKGNLVKIEKLTHFVNETFLINLHQLINKLNQYKGFGLGIEEPYADYNFMQNLKFVVDSLNNSLLHITEENYILRLLDKRLKHFNGNIDFNIFQDIDLHNKHLDLLIVNNYGVFPFYIQPPIQAESNLSSISYHMTQAIKVLRHVLKQYHLSAPIMPASVFVKSNQLRITGQISHQACYMNVAVNRNSLYQLIGINYHNQDKQPLSSYKVSVICDAINHSYRKHQSFRPSMLYNQPVGYFKILHFKSFLHDCRYVYSLKVLYSLLKGH